MGKRKKSDPKQWKQGEMKAYLAEQRALAQGAINREEAVKQKAYSDMWKKYVQAIYIDTLTKDVAMKTFKAGAFSAVMPIQPQYESELRRLGVPLVTEK